MSKERHWDKTDYFKKIQPIKITESKNLKIGVESWTLIPEFILESVKVNCYKPGKPTSTAVFKISDEAGQGICAAKGKSVGLLFGVSSEEWASIENLCHYGQQLFYRDFKDGLSRSYRCEQKLFFSFCSFNQTEDILVATFKRGVNTRNKDKDDTFINIMEIMKCTNSLLKLYTHYLHENNQ